MGHRRSSRDRSAAVRNPLGGRAGQEGMPQLADAPPALATYEAMAPVYDRFTGHHDYEDWTRTLEGLALAAGLRGRRLLDAACGSGKSFAPMLARGYDVTRVEISPRMPEREAGDRNSV